MRKAVYFVTIVILFLGSMITVHAADPILVKSIGMDSEVTLFVGKAMSIITSIEPQNATIKKLEWKSSDEAVATVNNGNIKGIACGEAIITAKATDASGTSASIRVNVIQPVKKISFSEKNVTIPAGVYYQLKTIVEPENASISKLEWTSSNENIVKVDDAGVVTGMSKGTANITATATDGSKVKTSIAVKVDSFDLVFTSKAPQKLKYEYSGVGSVTIKGSVKNGNVSISDIDKNMFFSGTAGEEVVVTPLHAGTDVVMIKIGNKKLNADVYVAEYFEEHETQYIELTDTTPNESNGSFRDIIWGTPYSEVKDKLVELYGQRYSDIDHGYGYRITFRNPGIKVAGHDVSSLSFGFCYAVDMDGVITKDEGLTSFHRAEYEFSVNENKDSIAENIYNKLCDLYGKSSSEFEPQQSYGYYWHDNEISISLNNNYDQLTLYYIWEPGFSRESELKEIYEYQLELEERKKDELNQQQYSDSTDGL